MPKPLPALLAALAVAACGGAVPGSNATGPAALRADPARACDMAEVGNRADPAVLGNPELYARLNRAMEAKARACAQAAGFTDVSRLTERAAGATVIDPATRIVMETTESSWLGIGTRDGRTSRIGVSSRGVVTDRPSIDP
jgi:hypothetical protein